jgi:putative membrane protein
MKRLAAMLPSMILLSSASIAFAASADDTAFATKAAQAGHAEVAEGEMAKTKAADPRVKEFAATMVKDHSAAGIELKDAASKAGAAAARAWLESAKAGPACGESRGAARCSPTIHPTMSRRP